jgi:GGDEF domain-containing protein
MRTGTNCTCSVGAALWQPGDSVLMLLSHADAALYEAKRLGRNRLAWAALD